MSNKFNPTDEQKAIIEPEAWQSSLVIAKAGSGKTTTIIHRAIKQAEIIENWESIAIISFTNKSSKDISNKIKNIEARSIIAMTFHAFLLQHVLAFSKIFKNKEVSFDYSKKVGNLEEWVRVIQEERIIPVASNSYNDYLFEYSIFLMRKKPYVLTYLKTKFVAIYIDEAQDNNMLQYEIVDSFLSIGIQVVLIGDPDQTIYQFRGADDAIFNGLKEHEVFRNNVYPLTNNFRCHELINKCANSYQVPTKHEFIEENNKTYGVFRTSSSIQEIKKIFEGEKYEGQRICFLFRSIKNNIEWIEGNDIPIIQYPEIIQRQSLQSSIAILDALFETYYGDNYLELTFIDRFLPNMRMARASLLIREFKEKPSITSFGTLNEQWNIFKLEDYESIINEMMLDSTKKFYNLYSNKFVAMTIHSAKGLEFENVVLYSPDFKNLQHDDVRKLFYVACTRAENVLIFM